jgi:carboxyl-terminal processing protease
VKIGRYLWIGLGAALAVGAGYAQLNSTTPPAGFGLSSSPKSVQRAGAAFAQVYAALNQIYLYKVSPTKLWEGAIQGMLSVAGSPFNYYFPPHLNSVLNQNENGKFYGIGVGIQAANPNGTGAVISVVYKGYPAIRAGLRAGDQVVSVDGKPVAKLNLDQIVALIRGPKGTLVHLVVKRGETLYHFAIPRAKVTIAAVQSTILPGKIGYIALDTFDNVRVPHQMARAIADMNRHHIHKLILDLRDNPGGLLCVGIDVANDFLTKGVIVQLKNRQGKVSPAYGCPNNGFATSTGLKYRGKLVVLVNHNTVSAAEIVTGALKDNHRATIVGEKTFGKGVAQDVLPLADGGTAEIVAQEWLRPNGSNIQGRGINPNVVVPDTRYPNPVTVSGAGAKPGSQVTVTVNGKTLTLSANAKGKFSYTAPVPQLPQSSVQSQALVNPKTDAELAKAIQILGGE